jgi:transposase
VRQRTQLINAIRGHLAEYGWVAPRGTAQIAMLAQSAVLSDELMRANPGLVVQKIITRFRNGAA